MTERLCIPYKMIVERRAKAVQLDLGEKEPVWFPRHRIELDEENYTVTADSPLIVEKLETARGDGNRHLASDDRPVRLAQASWENDSAIGIDVQIVRLDHKGGPVKMRVFFPKAKVTNGTAPAWLVRKKEEEVLGAFTKSGPYTVDHFAVRGLRAKKSA